MKEKVCIILRGVPGSGKSTWAVQFTQQFMSRPEITCVWCSTDSFFYDKQEIYHFDPTKLGENHQKCYEEFCEFVSCNVDFILLDNTNVLRKHYQNYIDIAKAVGYTCYQKVFNDSYGSIHNVPEETVQRMKNQFQEDVDLPHWR